MEYALLILLALAIPVAWTAAFFLALGARSRVFALETRFLALERGLAAAGAQRAMPLAEDIVRAPEPPPSPAAETEPAEPPAAPTAGIEPAPPPSEPAADTAAPPSEPPPEATPSTPAPPAPVEPG